MKLHPEGVRRGQEGRRARRCADRRPLSALIIIIVVIIIVVVVVVVIITIGMPRCISMHESDIVALALAPQIL